MANWPKDKNKQFYKLYTTVLKNKMLIKSTIILKIVTHRVKCSVVLFFLIAASFWIFL